MMLLLTSAISHAACTGFTCVAASYKFSEDNAENLDLEPFHKCFQVDIEGY